MTRAAPSPAARSRRRVALAVSIALHLIALTFIGALDRRALEAQPGENAREIVAIDRIRFEAHHPQPRAHERPKATPHRVVAANPLPRSVARTVVAPPPARRPLAVPRPLAQRVAPAHAAHARFAPARAASARAKGVLPSAKAVALAPHAGAATSTEPQLDDARIAAIEKSLGDAIARDKRGLDPLAVAAAAPAPVHHGLDANGITTGDRDHHGLCSPVKDWTAEGFDYYYLECNVRFSDGTYQRQSVPWPVRFRPDADPFAGTAPGGEPLQGPMPGWHLAAGAYISPELRAYALEHGGSI